MNGLKFLFLMLLLAWFPSRTFGWGCSDPLASRVDVGPTKPAGTAGDGDGQYYIGSDAANPKDYYVCEVPKPPTTTPSTSSQSQNQNQSSSNQSSSTSSSKATANSASNSSSSASNTLKNRVQATGGNSQSTATGGTSSLTNSGNSTLKDSGNSSNTNTNTAQGGSGGSATSNTSSTASAANNGNGSNNTSYNSDTNVAASKIPVNTAIGIAPPANLNCSIGYGGGAQTAALGVSAAFSRVDKNCARLTVALTARNRLSYCKVYITNKYAKEAHVTLEDCLGTDPVAVVAAPVIPTLAPQPVDITVRIEPPAPIPQPVIQATTEQYALLGTCPLDRKNQCDRIIDNVILSKPSARLRVVGPVDAGFVAKYARQRHSGISLEHVLSDDQNNTVSIYLLFPAESVAFSQ
jgi:hypothetical protein